MISGLGKIDTEDWKANTRLKHCTQDTNIVKWFWRAVTEYDEERRARLLQFVTGSARVPLAGFKALQGEWWRLTYCGIFHTTFSIKPLVHISPTKYNKTCCEKNNVYNIIIINYEI